MSQNINVNELAQQLASMQAVLAQLMGADTPPVANTPPVAPPKGNTLPNFDTATAVIKWIAEYTGKSYNAAKSAGYQHGVKNHFAKPSDKAAYIAYAKYLLNGEQFAQQAANGKATVAPPATPKPAKPAGGHTLNDRQRALVEARIAKVQADAQRNLAYWQSVLDGSVPYLPKSVLELAS